MKTPKFSKRTLTFITTLLFVGLTSLAVVDFDSTTSIIALAISTAGAAVFVWSVLTYAEKLYAGETDGFGIHPWL